MSKDAVTDAAVVAGVMGLSIGSINELLAMVGLALAIPVALFRIYVGFHQAREWHEKRRRGD